MKTTPIIAFVTALALTRGAAAGPWSPVFERACVDTDLALSPDGASVFACGAQFDAAAGRLLRSPPASVRTLLAPDLALLGHPEGYGLALGAPDESPARWRAHNVVVEAAAVSRDGTRLATLERTTLHAGRRLTERHALVVREVSSLRVLASAHIEAYDGAYDGGAVGFLPDGRAVALAPQTPCGAVGESVCEGEPLVALSDAGDLSPVAPAFEHVVRVGFAPDGTCAAVALASGAVKLVSLVDGTTLGEFPSEAAPVAVAASAGGARVAVASGSRVKLYAPERAEADLDAAQYGVTALTFARDGRTLFAAGRESLVAYREGGASPELHAVYTASLPDEYKAARVEGGVIRWPDEEYRDDFQPAHEFQVIAAYHGGELFTEVNVYAGDAGEFEPGTEADAWGREVVSRYFPPDVRGTERALRRAHFRAWGAPGARGASLDFEHEMGCELARSFWRFQERDGVLYRAEVTAIAPDATRSAQLTALFFDGPLGAPPAPTHTPRGGSTRTPAARAAAPRASRSAPRSRPAAVATPTSGSRGG